LELIEVDYEPLPAVIDPQKAMGAGAPQLHENAPNNQAFHWVASGGDVEAAFRDAQVVVRERIIQQRVLPHPMEPRSALAQWVGVTPPAILDLERVLPGEGEVVAARRLLQRIVHAYGRLIDVLVADALYLEAPFIRLALDASKHVVVVMKQEARELYQEAAELRALVPAQVIEDEDGSRTTRLWDLPDLPSFSTLGRSMRVVWVEETTTKAKRVGGQRQVVVEEHTWVWVTDLPAPMVPPTKIQRWGHDRWDLENRGFNELATLWHMDHCFVHAPVAIEALLLTLAVAFLTTYLFYARNLKPAARRAMTRLALASRLLEDLAAPAGASVWPTPRAP